MGQWERLMEVLLLVIMVLMIVTMAALTIYVLRVEL